MTKKLFVPNRILAQKNINPTPSPITKAFKEEPNKNEDDPSKLDSSTLDRLPQLMQQSQGNQTGEFTLRGQDLILALERSGDFRSRITG